MGQEWQTWQKSRGKTLTESGTWEGVSLLCVFQIEVSYFESSCLQAAYLPPLCLCFSVYLTCRAGQPHLLVQFLLKTQMLLYKLLVPIQYFSRVLALDHVWEMFGNYPILIYKRHTAALQYFIVDTQLFDLGQN